MQQFLLMLLVMMIGACTSTQNQYRSISATSAHNSINPVTQKDLLSGDTLLGEPLVASDLPEDNILAPTEEMETFLGQYVISKVSEPYRARQLNRVLFDDEIFGMKYDMTKTFTARGAFENKLGNCLAFSYLYSSFAEKAEILFEYQEVNIPLDWSPITGNIDKAWRHINLHVKNGADAGSVFDINEIKANQSLPSRTLTLPHALALYYSNIGAENLIEGNKRKAFLYFVKGITLTELEPDLWVNLGVLYKQNGHYHHARLAYETALEIDPESYTANANMANLYRTTGDKKKAAQYGKIAKEGQVKNPNYQYRMAQIEYNSKHYRKALTHLDYALENGIDESNYLRLREKINDRRQEKSQSIIKSKVSLYKWAAVKVY